MSSVQKSRVGRVALLVGALALFLFPPVAASAASSRADAVLHANVARITSVAFGGSASAPVITIRGSGLGTLPPPDPSGAPYRYQPGCSGQAPLGNKNDGYDYGADGLWVEWGRVQAGAYVSGSGGYLDCIGLVVKKYTSKEIVITLGCQYPYYSKLSSGTDFSVVVAGAKYKTAVRF